MKKVWHLVLISAVLSGCASGSAIVVGSVRPQISPEGVQLYFNPPTSYEVIALVKASSDAGWTEQGAVDYAIQELKEQAAKVGANGVILTGAGSRTSTVIGGMGTGFFYGIPVDSPSVEGKAIFVTSQQ